MASYVKRGQLWYYRFVDADGTQRMRKGSPDRRVTEDMAKRDEIRAAEVRKGLIDPKAEYRRRQGMRPLSHLLNEFAQHLVDKGNTEKHIDLYIGRARRVAGLVTGAVLTEIDPPKTTTFARRKEAEATLNEVLEAGRLSDLTPESVQSALSALRAAGRSLATCNHHRAAIRGFSQWLWKSGRIGEHLLVGVTGYNAEEDRRHDRRTISVAELRKLIAVAERGPAYRQMTGPDRALCYRLAVATGLRLSEIATITPRAFDWTADPPTTTVRAAYTKNGKTATLPLPPDLVSDLRSRASSMSDDTPLFPLPDRGADMLKIDLKEAGIPYRDANGLVFDFHSLRAETATLADQAGASPRVVQRLMRHSTLALTDRYTRPRDVDVHKTVLALPALKPADPEPGSRQPSEGSDRPEQEIEGSRSTG